MNFMNYNNSSLYSWDELIIKSIKDLITINEPYIMETLLGSLESTRKNISECTEWLNNNSDKISDDHDAYETYWPLYLYYDHLNNKIEAEKYLNLTDQVLLEDGLKETVEYYKTLSQ